MAEPKLVLIVIKSANIKKLKTFYEKLGMAFTKERHGKGPIHYSTVVYPTVLELYPLYREETPSYNRLGFEVPELDKLIKKLEHHKGVTVISPPKQTDIGYAAVIQDPEGRVVELYQKPA